MIDPQILIDYDAYEAERLQRFKDGLQAIRERRIAGEITSSEAMKLAIELRKELAAQ